MKDLNSPSSHIPGATESGFSHTETPQPAFSDNEVGSSMAESNDDMIRRVLSSYAVGAKLRQLRMRKKIALVDLGKHTGLSASMLSQLENGKLMPTLSTLARIAVVFDVGLEHFFGDRKQTRPFSIVRKDELIRFPDNPVSAKPAYLFECLSFAAHEKSMQTYMAEFPRRAASEVTSHAHEGAEFIHVLEGSLEIRYGGEEHILNPGDSVYFDPGETHSYRGLSRQPARALVVTTHRL